MLNKLNWLVNIPVTPTIKKVDTVENISGKVMYQNSCIAVIPSSLADSIIDYGILSIVLE